MGISTKAGDGGTTGLADGRRVPKDDPAIELLGDLDELASAIGLARAAARTAPGSPESDSRLESIQRALSRACALVAGIAPESLPASVADLDRLEAWIAEAGGGAGLRAFALPGAGELAARLDLARAVCRRAERQAVSVFRGRDPESLIPWLNRLSDLLFLLARAEES